MNRMVVVALVFPCLISTAIPADAPPAYEPESAYEAHEVQGFRVMANKRLAADTPAALRRVGELALESVPHFPDAFLGLARQVTIWVEAGVGRQQPNRVDNPSNTFYIPLSYPTGPSRGTL